MCSRISLLWYHTIIRPFFALDGEDEEAGAAEAERLLATATTEYANSPLFMYFRGKVLYLRSDLPQALQVYTAATALASEQREVEHIILYEKGALSTHYIYCDGYGSSVCSLFGVSLVSSI